MCRTVTRPAPRSSLSLKIAVYVARVRGGGEPMAEIVSRLAIGAGLDGLVHLQSEKGHDVDRMDQLDGQVCQRDELGLA